MTDHPLGTPLAIYPDIEAAGGLQDTGPRMLVLNGRLEQIGLLRSGTSGGRASVGMVVRLKDGRAVIAETTWRNLLIAVRALEAGPVGSEETLDD